MATLVICPVDGGRVEQGTCCRECGVYAGEPCADCGQPMYHNRTCPAEFLPCGHANSVAVTDDLASDREDATYCGECALLDLAQETTDGIAAGDEYWAGTMAERAVAVARKLGRGL